MNQYHYIGTIQMRCTEKNKLHHIPTKPELRIHISLKHDSYKLGVIKIGEGVQSQSTL